MSLQPTTFVHEKKSGIYLPPHLLNSPAQITPAQDYLAEGKMNLACGIIPQSRDYRIDDVEWLSVAEQIKVGVLGTVSAENKFIYISACGLSESHGAEIILKKAAFEIPQRITGLDYILGSGLEKRHDYFTCGPKDPGLSSPATNFRMNSFHGYSDHVDNKGSILERGKWKLSSLDTGIIVGHHLIFDKYNCTARELNDADKLRDVMIFPFEGYQIVDEEEHKIEHEFQDEGKITDGHTLLLLLQNGCGNMIVAAGHSYPKKGVFMGDFHSAFLYDFTGIKEHLDGSFQAKNPINEKTIDTVVLRRDFASSKTQFSKPF